jgi:hypothetical protein
MPMLRLVGGSLAVVFAFAKRQGDDGVDRPPAERQVTPATVGTFAGRRSVSR